MREEQIGLYKHISELFNWQANNVQPIEESSIAQDITVIAKSVKGSCSSTFEVKVGECLYRYFIEDRKGIRHIKFTTSISEVVEDSVYNRGVSSAYDFAGIPVLKI